MPSYFNNLLQGDLRKFLTCACKETEDSRFLVVLIRYSDSCVYYMFELFIYLNETVVEMQILKLYNTIQIKFDYTLKSVLRRIASVEATQ